MRNDEPEYLKPALGPGTYRISPEIWISENLRFHEILYFQRKTVRDKMSIRVSVLAFPGRF